MAAHAAGAAPCRTCGRPRGENVADGTRCERCVNVQNAVTAALIALWIATDVFDDGAQVAEAAAAGLVTVVALIPAAFGAVLLHELAHAATARLLRQAVPRIVVGEGRRLATMGRAVELVIGSTLVGNGFTHVVDYRPRLYRTRWTITLMAAPLVSVAAGIAFWVAGAQWPGLERIAIRVFAGANWFLAAISLIPVPTFGGRIWSDLSMVLWMWRAREAELDEYRMQSVGALVTLQLERGDVAEALATARANAATAAGSIMARGILAHALHETGQLDEARDVARAALSLPMDDAWRAYLGRFMSPEEMAESRRPTVGT